MELNHGDVFSYLNHGTYTLCELPVSNLWILICNVNGNYWCRPGTDPEDAFGGDFDKFKREFASQSRPKKFLLFSFPEGTAEGIESVYKGSYDTIGEAMHYKDAGLIQIVCRDTMKVLDPHDVLPHGASTDPWTGDGR